jgi:hypothetical protein
MRRSALLAAVATVALTGAAAAQSTVTVNPSAPGPRISREVLGANMALWFDPTQSDVGTALQQSNVALTRWPGGSESDQFHWQTTSACAGTYVDANATFDQFMASVAVPAGLDVAITLNYGSNSACDAGGDPAEAAAWVAYAKNKDYRVSYWTVGNESYGSWEYDLHPLAHDPATYAAAVAGGYYPRIKAANHQAQVGVVVEPDYDWDAIVLARAPFDFVEYHWYAQTPGQESDLYLLTQAPQALTAELGKIKAELAKLGKSERPIYVGELGSVYTAPGKQTTSITQALFAGEVLGELMNDGIERATWWLGFGGCGDATSSNFSPALYGWQNFSGYMIFSDGTPEYGCPDATAVPRGTPLPTARAFQLMAQVAKTGEYTLAAVNDDPSGNLRSYAATHGAGYALVLFNLGQTSALPVEAAIGGLARASSVTISTYGKAQYDQSQQNIWAGPVSQTLGAQALPLALTLPAWSMSVVIVLP